MRRDCSNYDGRVRERWASVWTRVLFVLTVVVLLASNALAVALMLGWWSP